METLLPILGAQAGAAVIGPALGATGIPASIATLINESPLVGGGVAGIIAPVTEQGVASALGGVVGGGAGVGLAGALSPRGPVAAGDVAARGANPLAGLLGGGFHNIGDPSARVGPVRVGSVPSQIPIFIGQSVGARSPIEELLRRMRGRF